MKVGYVSYEVAPFAKVGGLADVAGALPKYLEKIGEDVYVIMPFHSIIEKKFDTSKFTLEKEEMYPNSHSYNKPFSLYSYFLPNSNVKIYFIKNSDIFGKDVYEKEDERLALQSSYFSDGVLSVVKEFEKDTEVLNINDWQTAIISVYLKINYFEDSILGKISTVLTIHNLGYQGIFPPEMLEIIGLPTYLYNVDALEFYGNINYLKGGILFADIINTVSKTYSEEIQTAEYGYKLDGVLRIRSDKLYGIINGIDYEKYNPLNEKNIFSKINDYSGKIKNKLSLQKLLKLPQKEDVPIISLISRLVDQKGLDLVKEVSNYLLLYDVQLVILGTGQEGYENYFKKLQEKYPNKVSANIMFDEDLAFKIYAGSDMFLMPSKYEPCGLGQMYAMRYGTVPIVRYTGGLSDTVREYYNPNSGTGFGFYEYEPCKMLMAVSKALYQYKIKKDNWIKLFENIMKQDFSYENTAKQYKELYKMASSNKNRW
ncbi:glycogen synthase [Tepiditoga spiralis]|uniref:Glycogen synthase n=1 Tax=Tepiditoga spiralis TaxID=2108365 RepID=A0A7G1G6X4_9BACT|nr:glycogen/starch synthase [Tepiditoga spiralis]BBE30657.1 glycogen synthase [Tepiditoga spiralis]